MSPEPRRIFFSWQADTPTSVGRNFLRSVLNDVCKRMSTDTDLEEALRDLEVDSDTQGVPGQPPIVETIFQKIDAAHVFVADMTFVGKRLDGRSTPNPNVLIEYGWALRGGSHTRIVCLANTAYGEISGESLPFNMRHVKWPITYGLSEGASPEEKAAERKRLTTVLTGAIRASLELASQKPSEPTRFPKMLPKDGPARFRGESESLGFDDDFPRGSSPEVFLDSGPAMWLRLLPAAAPGRVWPIHELRELARENISRILPLVHGSGGYSSLKAEDGVGVYRPRAGEDRNAETDNVFTSSVTFVFETGEIWSVDTALLAYDPRRLFQTDIEKAFSESLGNYAAFLGALGLEPPYLWEAGMVGIKGRHLGYTAPPGHYFSGEGPKCLTDLIEVSGVYDGSSTTTAALLPFFERLFEKCGLKRPMHLPQA